jgi:hypothetical protein
MRALNSAFLFILLPFPLLVFATTPASDESILCDATHVLVGTVEKAVCWKDGKRKGESTAQCSSQNAALLAIDISEVWAVADKVKALPRDPGIAVGKKIVVYSQLYNSEHFPANEMQGKLGVVPPIAGTVPDAVISEMFTGKKFIFSVSVRAVSRVSLPSGEIVENYLPPLPYQTNVWRLGMAEWVKKTLTQRNGQYCLKLTPSPD